MSHDQEYRDIAKTIIDSNLYMTLGTADESGRPWVSPVYFASCDHYRDFYWVSSPDATHSRNLAQRPALSIVIFDSRVPAEREAGPLAAGELLPPADSRMYRATVSAYSILCPKPLGEPCVDHGIAPDHRTAVTL
jgi:Pyridoxamine 5'-phosphate oxidase